MEVYKTVREYHMFICEEQQVKTFGKRRPLHKLQKEDVWANVLSLVLKLARSDQPDL